MDVKDLVSFFAGILFWIWILSQSLLPILFLLGYKLLSIGVAKIYYGANQITCAEPCDTLFTLENKSGQPFVNWGLFCRLDSSISVEILRIKFDSIFLKNGGLYSRFFCQIKSFMGHSFFWKESKLDLSCHIYKICLQDDEAIERFLFEWMKKSYGVKPPWQIAIIECRKKRFLAFKIHHGLADGYSLVHILDKLCSTNSLNLVKKGEQHSIFQQVNFKKNIFYAFIVLRQ